MLKIKKFPITEYQRKFLYGEERFTITLAATKVGKTTSHLYYIFEKAITVVGIYWWVAPVYSQALIAANRLIKIIEPMLSAGICRYNISKMEIIFTNGSRLVFKSALNINALYGEDVNEVVFDEASRSTFEAFVALRSVVTATRGKIKMIANYIGENNWLSKLAKEKAGNDSSYVVYRVTAYDAVDAGILTAEEVEQAKKDLPPQYFDALYCVKGSIDNYDLFKYYIPDFFYYSYSLTGRKVLGVDVSFHGADRFVLLVRQDYLILDICILSKTNPVSAVMAIQEIQKKHNISNRDTIFDADGVGSALVDMLPGVKQFHGGAKAIVEYKNLKTECYFNLSIKWNSSNFLVHPDIPIKLVEEMAEELFFTKKNDCLEVIPKKYIKASLGRSPDIADALMMTEYFFIKNSNLKIRYAN